MAEVKRKLKTTLSTWNLTQGVIPGIDNWKTVFGSEMINLLIRYLLPRFRPHMAEFEVNPRDQDLALLEDVLQWASFFSLETMAEFIKTDFFPKWHESLYVWLTTPSVNYDEVGQWYQWWKSAFEEQVSAEFNERPPISLEWQKGLELMLQASELGPTGTAELPRPQVFDTKNQDPANGTRKKKNLSSTKEDSPTPKYQNLSDPVPSFKDIVDV